MKIKQIITIGAIGIFSLSSNQSNAQLKVGADFLPLTYSKNSEEKSEFGYGFNLYGKYELKNNFRVGLNLGLSSKPYSFLGYEGKNKILSSTALFEYKFNLGRFSPYIGFETGVFTLFSEKDAVRINKTFYGISPVVGLEYKINEWFFLNASVKHQTIYGNNGAKESGLNFGLGIGIKF